MTRSILCLMMISMLTACSGRYAHPIMVNQLGDKNMTCEEIEHEMCQIQHEIRKLIPQSNKTGKNVGLGVAGLFFIFPWFLMDLTSAEKEEIQAYQQRYNALERLAIRKNCDCLKEKK